MRFEYRSYPTTPSPADDSDTIWQPDLMVLVAGSLGELPMWGALDTGSDECVLPFSIAERVGPVWSNRAGLLTDYTGRPHAVHYGAITLQIRLNHLLIRWAAVVAFDRQREESALWGGAGFLDHFRVTFDGPARHFTIRLPAPWPAGLAVEPLARRLRRPTIEGRPILPADQDPRRP